MIITMEDQSFNLVDSFLLDYEITNTYQWFYFANIDWFCDIEFYGACVCSVVSSHGYIELNQEQLLEVHAYCLAAVEQKIRMMPESGKLQ